MATEQPIGSILVADCGAVMTKAVLLGRVGGAYRFIARGEAPTTADAPWYDVAVGLQHAIAQIEDVTGRTLLQVGGQLIIPEEQSGIGVDALVVLASAAQPLRVLLSGLVRDISLVSAEHAVAGTYATIAGVISRDPSQGWMSEEEQVRLIAESRPELICIVGGCDGGATLPVLELVETAALGCALIEKEKRPSLIFAGNAALRQRVVHTVGDRAEVRVTDNVRPLPDQESPDGLRAELESFYAQSKLEQLPGSELLAHWSALPITPTAKAFSQLIHYVWYLDESPKGTLGIDLGAAHTTVASAFAGHPGLTVRSDLGAVSAGRRLLGEKDPSSILRWLPVPMELDEARAILLNWEARPWTVPQEPQELWLAQAVAREAIRETLRTAQRSWQPGKAQLYPHLTPLLDPILLSGGLLAGAPRPGQAVLLALDAIQPIGISTVLLDLHGLAPALGGVARLKPLAAVEILDSGCIVNLATVVTPVGEARKGEVVLRVRVQYEQGGMLDVEVPYGSLEVLPLPPGQEAVLELRPRGRFDVGLGGSGKGGRRRVRGGLAGLIIDARGRPLELPQEPSRRQKQIQQWLWDVGG